MKRIRVLPALLLASLVLFWVWTRQPAEPALDPTAVVAQIRQLNQLATVRYTVQKVVGLEEQRQPVGSEKILLVVQASVDAGIDLAGLQPRDVSTDKDGTVTLRLPPARILNVAVDEKQTKVWDREKTWWTPWVPYSRDFEQRARIAGVDAIRQAALDMGILRQAERNAESAISTLLGLAGVRKVVVIPASVS